MEGTAYQKRIFDQALDLVRPLGTLNTALDFGSGNGWFCKQFRQSGLFREVSPIDVQERKQSLVKPTLYDGNKLPFPDAAFDLVYSFDVLHHCPDPLAALNELLRCTKRFFLLKDHTYSTRLGQLCLAVMDEIGNRRFGVPSLYHYQKNWDWLPRITAQGFREVRRIHPLRCHVRLMGAATNRLQFLGLWERDSR
jgi:SAM-dependent methyltransferase